VNGRTDQAFNDINILLINHHPNVKNLPKGIATFFSKVEWLQMWKSGLISITKEDLKPFSNLKLIRFISTQIESLEEDLFQFNPKLTRIELNLNKIKHVGANLLNSLTYLESADFSSNVCINKKADNRYQIQDLIRELETNCEPPATTTTSTTTEKPTTTTSTTTTRATTENSREVELALLKIKYEALEKENQVLKMKNSNLDEDLDEALLNLQILSKELKKVEDSCQYERNEPIESQKVELKCKRIGNKTCFAVDFQVKFRNSEIDRAVNGDGSEMSTSGVGKLIIESRKVLFMPSKIGEKFPKLTNLILISSGLFMIDSNAFKNLNELTSLNLAENKLQEISSQTFNELKNLRDLDLSSNKISEIETGTFDENKNLESINLKANKIVFLNPGIFVQLVNLKTLNLSSNQLMTLRADILPINHKLIKFDASDNKLEKIERKLFRAMQKDGKLVNLTGNNCIDAKFDADDSSSKTFYEIYSLIDLQCFDEY
jgi:Leucine-rich repeat (LRR) protein